MRKWQALIILLAITLGTVVPPSVICLSDQGAVTAISTLDVCHSATPALSSNGDMPYVNESAVLPLPLARNNVVEYVNPSFQPLNIAFQDERPPKH